MGAYDYKDMLEVNQVLVNTEHLQIVTTSKMAPLATESYQQVQRKTYGDEDNQKFWDSGAVLVIHMSNASTEWHNFK